MTTVACDGTESQHYVCVQSRSHEPSNPTWNQPNHVAFGGLGLLIFSNDVNNIDVHTHVAEALSSDDATWTSKATTTVASTKTTPSDGEELKFDDFCHMTPYFKPLPMYPKLNECSVVEVDPSSDPLGLFRSLTRRHSAMCACNVGKSNSVRHFARNVARQI